MEDATQALYMAFAVFVFVVAITVAFVSFANVREVSDVILHKSDPTYYADYEIANENGKSRIVGLETIIPTLHKYYKENFTVVFRSANSFKPKKGEFNGLWDYLKVYETNNKNNYRNFVNNIKKDNYNKLMNKKYQIADFLSNSTYIHGNQIDIFSFDSEEEQLRNEPWTTSEEEYKKNVNAFLQGEEYVNTRNGLVYNDYRGKGFISQYGNSIWVESIGEYIKDTTTNSLADIGSDEISHYTEKTLENESVRNSKKKRIIIFTKVNSIDNS